VSVGHYENFPVASLLCPPALRPPIRAIYAFARTADDLADEGDAAPTERLAALARFRLALNQVERHGQADAAPEAWPQVFAPLAEQMRLHRLPAALLHDLLDAFEQDVPNPLYPGREPLLAYCAKSANPVGRLLLHLYGITDAQALTRSDAICTALQLINFWQDLSVDLPRGRCYLPLDDARRHGVDPARLHAQGDSPASQALLQDLVQWTAQLMTQGAPLATTLPGRVGWELRGVVQGGWRILERIARMNYRTVRERPRLQGHDLPVLAWRALRMKGRALPALSLFTALPPSGSAPDA
jgi:squalene synthase HpnC